MYYSKRKNIQKCKALLKYYKAIYCYEHFAAN
jgi:hypothetical protein